MAAIDKTYISSWEQWKELRDWIWPKEFILKNGIKIKLKNYMYYPEYGEKEVTEWLESRRRECMKNYGWTYEKALECCDVPFWSTPTYVDIWLIRNCPLEWVQDRLKEQYGGGWSKEAFTNHSKSYDSIKSGTSVYDTWQRNGLGKNFRYKVIKKPNWHHIHCFRYIDRQGQEKIYKDDKNNVWWVELRDQKHPYGTKGHIMWWANENYNYWTCDEEALPKTCSSMTLHGKQPSLKSIIRIIQKWNLPEGTRVIFDNTRFKFGWIIDIKKK